MIDCLTAAPSGLAFGFRDRFTPPAPLAAIPTRLPRQKNATTVVRTRLISAIGRAGPMAKRRQSGIIKVECGGNSMAESLVPNEVVEGSSPFRRF
jgi:hypothetical protein